MIIAKLIERNTMKVQIQDNKQMGVFVSEFNDKTASDQDIQDLKELIYKHKIVVIKDQDLSPHQYCDFGRRLGELEKYYQPMYHHPEREEIFVSSNVSEKGKQMGVPKTGRFWHADYAFMPKPFAFSMIYPQVIPSKNRGTYFIDMSKAFKSLPDDLKSIATESSCHHSVRRYFKIRPEDVYRPISEVLDEIDRLTPPSEHPTTFTHPVTGETILYITEGFTYRINDSQGEPIDISVLDSLLAESGQLDKSFEHSLIELHQFELGDLRIWDNRSLVHCAHYATSSEPATTLRLTLHDSYPGLSGNCTVATQTPYPFGLG